MSEPKSPLFDVEILSKIPDIDFQEASTPIVTEEFRKTVLSRRSVRVFDSTPIPETVVNDCIDLALAAPNSSNLQPWEFLWIRTPEIKARLVKYCFSQPAARTAAELIVCVARIDTWREHSKLMIPTLQKQGSKVPKSALDYYDRLVPLHYTQGVFSSWGWIKRTFMSIIGLYKLVPREPNSRADMRVWAAKSTSLAAENMMLAFRAHGFDSCPMEGFDSVRTKRLLGLGRGAEIAMIIAAGKRSPKGVYGPRIRFERSRFVKEI